MVLKDQDVIGLLDCPKDEFFVRLGFDQDLDGLAGLVKFEGLLYVRQGNDVRDEGIQFKLGQEVQRSLEREGGDKS